MRLADYIDLIQQLPSKNHSFTIRKENWQNTSQQYEIDRLFEDNQIITLNRYDLITAFHNNTFEFILKTLMWGYPVKGRGNNIDNLLEKENFYKLIQTLDSYKSGTILKQQLENDLKSIKSLGLSTMSKFLCFMQATVENEKSLILDRRIIDILNSGVFEELYSLRTIHYPTSVNRYIEYLKVINEFSKKNNLESENVEMFIFMFGKHLSPLQGEECYDDITEADVSEQKSYRDMLIEALKNLTAIEQNIFTNTLNLLMYGDLKDVNKVFEINEVYNFNIDHLKNSNDKNVSILVELIQKIELSISNLKQNNSINDSEVDIE